MDLLIGGKRFEHFIEGLVVVVKIFHVIGVHGAGAGTHQVDGCGAMSCLFEKLDGLELAPSPVLSSMTEHKMVLLLQL